MMRLLNIFDGTNKGLAMKAKRWATLMLFACAMLFACREARAFYNPQTGRWLSRDPIGERGGVSLYEAFCNNPLVYVDRNGLDNWSNPSGGQNAPPVIIYPPTPTADRAPIRPDNRNEPQRRPESLTGRRVERLSPVEPSRGDRKCTGCGPEVSAGLGATMSVVKTRFDALSDDEKAKRCALSHLFGTWDINFPSPPPGCGEGACYETVMVSGKCYDKWKVNYILFGRISSLCDFWRIKMEGVVAAQKLIRKPLVDGDWENEYTGDVRGFMRIGYDWNGSLPAGLPGPTGGFGGCKSCDKAGAKDPKYSAAFGTTWP
ncbi:MAG: RHS repeat-associated core domain-containing protein [Verrucomicrobiota bacterium]